MRAGGGSSTASSTRVKRPSNVTRSPASSRRTIVERLLEPRRRGGRTAARTRGTPPRSSPAPSAATSRPPLSSSTAAACRASIAGRMERGAGDERAELDALVTPASHGERRPAVPRAALGTAVAAVEQMVADPERVEARPPRRRAPSPRSSSRRTTRSTSGSWTPTFTAQNASNAGGSVGMAVIRCQMPSRVVDQQHLVDVELAAEPPAPRAVDGDRVLVVGERPARASLRYVPSVSRRVSRKSSKMRVAARRTPARPGTVPLTIQTASSAITSKSARGSPPRNASKTRWIPASAQRSSGASVSP